MHLSRNSSEGAMQEIHGNRKVNKNCKNILFNKEYNCNGEMAFISLKTDPCYFLILK